jgi:hypothetical protein
MEGKVIKRYSALQACPYSEGAGCVFTAIRLGFAQCGLLSSRRLIMRGILTKIFITLLLFVAIIHSSAWAGSEQVTIIYSNNINGQIDPVG